MIGVSPIKNVYRVRCQADKGPARYLRSHINRLHKQDYFTKWGCSRVRILRSRSWRSASSRCWAALRGQLSPATGAIVRDDLLEHRREGRSVDLLALPNCDGPGGLVVVSAGDEAVGVGHDPAVIQ